MRIMYLKTINLIKHLHTRSFIIFVPDTKPVQTKNFSKMKLKDFSFFNSRPFAIISLDY